jgi:hypothetical protein
MEFFVEGFRGARVLKVQAELMTGFLHHRAQFLRGIGALAEEDMGGSSIRIQDAKDRLQLIEITQAGHARERII